MDQRRDGARRRTSSKVDETFSSAQMRWAGGKVGLRDREKTQY
jgi:hypothetical protein